MKAMLQFETLIRWCYLCLVNLSKLDGSTNFLHIDFMKWKHFPRYWPFMRGTNGHRWFPPQRPVTRNFLDLRLNKWLSKQSKRLWCKTPSHHYDVIVIALSKKLTCDGALRTPVFHPCGNEAPKIAATAVMASGHVTLPWKNKQNMIAIEIRQGFVRSGWSLWIT